MKIRIAAGKHVANATFVDNDTARHFASLLPLTLPLKDYASTEKVADLPARLRTAGAPAGYTPVRGDLAHYAPWGNLAIFYKDFSYSPGLIKLGQIDVGLDVLAGLPDGVQVTIERVGN